MLDRTYQTFDVLLEKLKHDPDVLGALLSGAHGKGFATPTSDYDIVIVVRDGALTGARTRYPFRYAPGIECILHDLSGFGNYATFGSPEAWDRYAFARVTPLFDQTGEVTQLVQEKGVVPPEQRSLVLRGSLDAYLNGLYRSLKCWGRGDELGARLEATGSLSPVLDFLFALEGRQAPFAGYLERELRSVPLNHLPLSSDAFLGLIKDVVLTAGPREQQALLKVVEGLARQGGLEDVLNGWDDSYGLWQDATYDGLVPKVP